MHTRHEGTLWKWTNYWNGWQPRWFVLDKGTLSYYKSQDEISLGCKGSVNVAAAEITAHPSDPYRLDVVVPGEVNFYLRAGSPHERQEWLVALGSVKSCINTVKASKGINEEEQLRRKHCELRLYCDLLVQQVHSIKSSVVENPIPDVKQLDENTGLLSETCDTFIRTLDECMKLTYRPLVQGDSKSPPLSPLAVSTAGHTNPLAAQNARASSKSPSDHAAKQNSAASISPGAKTKTANGHHSNGDRIPTFFSEMEPSFAHITLGQDGSVPTDAFLQSCSSLVKLLDHLGSTSFAHVKMDLNGHLRKITLKFESDPRQFNTLHRIVSNEVEHRNVAGPNSATEALTWTRRSLAFLREFLHSYEQGQTDLAAACAEAYTKTLKPHHDWVVRGVFTIACKSAVSRDQFAGSLSLRPDDPGTEAFERQLRSDVISCVAGIDRCLKALEKLYAKNELDSRNSAAE